MYIKVKIFRKKEKSSDFSTVTVMIVGSGTLLHWVECNAAGAVSENCEKISLC